MQATVNTFIQFLKENNVYKKFQDYLSKLRSLTIEEYWETLEDANNAIYGAFFLEMYQNQLSFGPNLVVNGKIK